MEDLAFKKIKKMLAKNKFKKAISNKKNEWEKISKDTYINKHNKLVFKDDNGIFFLEAILWKTDTSTFIGEVENINSYQYIKKIPFVPKTFYIKVIKENGEYKIKDYSKLKEVKKYYKNIDKK